jgi:hypothetical protein
MPKALFPRRAIGATTAAAVTLHTAGAAALIFVSSLHTVPLHQARCRPVRRHRLDQPAPAHRGGYAGLTGFHPLNHVFEHRVSIGKSRITCSAELGTEGFLIPGRRPRVAPFLPGRLNLRKIFAILGSEYD